MYIHGKNPDNPIFLVDERGNYLMESDGSYALFEGEAELAGDHLVSAHGYYLVDTNGAYLRGNGMPDGASSQAATQIMPAATSTQVLGAHTQASGQPASIPPAGHASHTASSRISATDLRTPAEAQSDRRNTIIVALAVLLLLALVAVAGLLARNFFSSSEQAPAESAPPTTVESTEPGSPIHTAGEQPTEEPSESPSPSQSAEVTAVPVPAGVYPGAGRTEIPEGATPMATDSGISLVTTPSGNITCAFGEGIAECRVASWNDTQPYGRSGGDDDNEWANAKVTFASDGTAGVGPVSDAIPQVGQLPYGSAAYSGSWVCGSEQNGITCWNTETGHGAIINRDGYQAF